MKYQPGFTDFFMSPVTGRIILPMFPDLYQNYVWIGNRNDRPLPSPIIIDLRLEIIDLRRRLSATRFILQAASQDFDSSQALNELIPGILRHTDGIVSIALPWVDYVPPILPEKNIWIGNSDDQPEPYPRIFLENLPSMLSDDPDKLLGAYNLYRGSPDEDTLGIPEIVKTLHITNMADLTVGHLWIGTDSSDPLNFGPNRPVEIVILPLDNMANLPHNKIWRGDSGDRPVAVNDLTDLEARVTITEGDITSILSDIASILSSIATIFSSISSILSAIDGILSTIATLTADITVIDTTLIDLQTQIDTLVTTTIDLQAQIDANVASGLDHLADLQLQIDDAIASGNDHLTIINTRLTALETCCSANSAAIDTINATLTTIDGEITTINTTLTTIASEITTINSTITTIQGNITTLFSDISTINTTLTSLQNQINTINTTLTSLQSQINTINTTLTTISGQITTINSTLTSLQSQINSINTQITTINTTLTSLQSQITAITTSFVAGGIMNMNGYRIKNLPCDPVEDDDAISFCFLWHTLHDEVTVSWS